MASFSLGGGPVYPELSGGVQGVYAATNSGPYDPGLISLDSRLPKRPASSGTRKKWLPQPYDESVRPVHAFIFFAFGISLVISLLVLFVNHMSYGLFAPNYVMVHWVRTGKNITGTGDCSSNSPCVWGAYSPGGDELMNLSDNILGLLFLDVVGFGFLSLTLCLDFRAHKLHPDPEKPADKFEWVLFGYMLDPYHWWQYVSIYDRTGLRRSIIITLMEMAQLANIAACVCPMIGMNASYVPTLMAALVVMVCFASWHLRDNYDKVREYLRLHAVNANLDAEAAKQGADETDWRRASYKNFVINGMTMKHIRYFEVDKFRDGLFMTIAWILITVTFSYQVRDSPALPQKILICVVFFLIWLAFVMDFPVTMAFSVMWKDHYRHRSTHEWSDGFWKSTIFRLFMLLLVPLVVGGVLSQFFLSGTPGFTYNLN